MSTVKKIVLFFVVLLFISCSASKKAFETAVLQNTKGAYISYLNLYPNSKKTIEIKQRLAQLEEIEDNQAWSRATKLRTMTDFLDYIQKFPNGKYVEIANKQIQDLKQIESQNRAWADANRLNTVQSYENFIQSFPESSHNYEARQKISELKDQYSWETAEQQNTIESYKYYITQNPNGKYLQQANSKIKALDEENRIRPIWSQTLEKNNYRDFQQFMITYRGSKFAELAKHQMDRIDQNHWIKATTKNTIAAYQDYIKQFPTGLFAYSANKKIIDLEVDRIFGGKNSTLPSMQRANPFSFEDKKEYGTIHVKNETKYTITIYYSGVQSKKLII